MTETRTLGGLNVEGVSQLPPQLNLLLYGESGVGKTMLAGSAAAVPRMSPVLLIDVEGGTLSLRHSYPDVDVVRVQTWDDMSRVFEGLVKGENDYNTVILDSLTEIQKFCYAADTEVLTLNGWKYFENLDEDELVAQYEQGTEEIKFVQPSKIVSFDHNDDMVSIPTSSSNLLVTPNHRMLVKQHGTMVRRADQIANGQKLPTGGVLHSEGGPSPELARVLVSWAADGISNAPAGKSKWGLKKEDKKDRLRKLLSDAGILFEEKQYSDGQWRLTADIDLEEVMPNRVWDWDHLLWSTDARQAVMDELQYWDARSPRPGHVIYNTKRKENADVVNAIACVTGYSSSVVQDDNGMYRVNVVHRTWRTISNHHTEHYKGKVWCVTVPSGFIVTRRNGKVTVSGNSMYGIMHQLSEKEPDRDPDVPGMREWGKNIEQIRRLVRAFRDLPMNTVFTALAMSDKDARTGVSKTKPSLSGKLSSEIAAFVDVVTYMYVKTVQEQQKRMLLTLGTEQQVAKDRTANLPPVVEDPTMTKLYELAFNPNAKQDQEEE